MKKLLNKFTDTEIIKRIFELYPDQKNNLKGYVLALDELRNTPVKKSTLLIYLERIIDEDEEYVDVSGYNPDEPEVTYALDFTPWPEWLGMEIKQGVLEEFSKLDVLAHCIWEITWHGYAGKEIEEKAVELFSRVEEVISPSSQEKDDKKTIAKSN
jgi:hypothetical protein